MEMSHCIRLLWVKGEPFGFDRTLLPALCPALSGQPITRTCRKDRER